MIFSPSVSLSFSFSRAQLRNTVTGPKNTSTPAKRGEDKQSCNLLHVKYLHHFNCLHPALSHPSWNPSLSTLLSPVSSRLPIFLTVNMLFLMNDRPRFDRGLLQPHYLLELIDFLLQMHHLFVPVCGVDISWGGHGQINTTGAKIVLYWANTETK